MGGAAAAMTTTVFAHGGPFYSWAEWDAHRKECPECRPKWELEQQAIRRVAKLLRSNVLLTRDWMPADPARFGQTPTALAPTASNATQTP